MKILFKIPFLLLVISLTQASDKTDGRYKKYYKNYCEGNFKNLSKLGAFLTCTGDDATPTLEGEKEISGILKNLESQNLQELCTNPDNFKGSDELILADDSKNIFSLPANECSCSIRAGSFKKVFCSISFEESQKVPKIEAHLDLLRKIDSIENYDENFSRCASTIFPNGELKNIQEQIKEIESLIEFNQTSNSKLTSILELLKFAPTEEPKASDSSKCTAIKENNDSRKVLDITFKDGSTEIDHIRRNAVYECLAGNTKQEVIKNANTKRASETIEIPSPDLAIDPDDSETIKQAKYAIQERRNNYSKVLEESTVLTKELSKLTDEIENVTSEKQLNEIYSKISAIKSKLKSFGKYGYSFKNHSSKFKDAKKKIAQIARDKGYKISNFDDDDSSFNNRFSNITPDRPKSIERTSNSVSTTTNTSTKKNEEYTPFYQPKKPVKRTNIVAPTRKEQDEEKQAQITKNKAQKKTNIQSTFSSAPSASRSSSRSPASASTASVSLESYEIPNEKKEPEVLNDAKFPNIKVVFIDDKKIMKLFKLENRVYQLKEEISKDDFMENFENFPSDIQEQGRDFFGIFDAKKLQ